MSISTLEKPMEHVPLAEYQQRFAQLRRACDDHRHEATALRHTSRQSRTDTNLDVKWSTYQNNLRLTERLTEVTRWREVLDACLVTVKKEIRNLKEERSITEQALETVITIPLSVVSECITLRDGRHGDDLNQDEAYDNLIKERDVVEALKNMLCEKIQASWEQLNKLGAEEFKLELDLSNKDSAIEIELYNLNIDKNCSGTSYKPDPLRIPSNCIPYEEWLETSRANKRRSDAEITTAIRLREAMYASRERAFNALQAQLDATNFTLRRRVYETQRAKNELEWQGFRMKEDEDMLLMEIDVLEASLRDKTESVKLAETRLENRMFRCGPELVQDPGADGLAHEVKHLREIRDQLRANIDAARTMLNKLETLRVTINNDLDNKNHALMTDLRVIDTRKRLLAIDRTPDAKIAPDFQLTKMLEEIPPVFT